MTMPGWDPHGLGGAGQEVEDRQHLQSERRYGYSESKINKAAPATLPKQVRVDDLQPRQGDPRVTAQQYRQASERLLTQARAGLSGGSLAQTSGKGWGAAAQMLKAIAEQRGWEHLRHRYYHITHRAANRLRSETGDTESVVSSTPPGHSTRTSMRTTWTPIS